MGAMEAIRREADGDKNALPLEMLRLRKGSEQESLWGAWDVGHLQRDSVVRGRMKRLGRETRSCTAQGFNIVKWQVGQMTLWHIEAVW